MSRPCNINVFHWNRECFFFRHNELNSGFIVMTTSEVTLDRPEIGAGFSVISWFCRLRLHRFTLNFSTEIFTPHGRFSPCSGFSLHSSRSVLALQWVLSSLLTVGSRLGVGSRNSWSLPVNFAAPSALGNI